ncbi:hypothetical protein WJX81_008257 [Elliptochloris bilobata]|uniref:Methyl-CpG-binding domain protein 4 n=1 Tax=Elliptochloris bilobata TaxID=381761 RepID=A0AAW1QNI3_9CHLO
MRRGLSAGYQGPARGLPDGSLSSLGTYRDGGGAAVNTRETDPPLGWLRGCSPVSSSGRDGSFSSAALDDSDATDLSPSDATSASLGACGNRGGRFMAELAAAMAARRGERGATGGRSPLALALEARPRKRVQAGADALQAEGDPRVATWEPPASPFGLVEEELYGDPWRLLVACILLNKTSITQVRAVIWRLFELAPTPAALAAADPAAIRAIIEPLGLAPKRVPMLQRFSREYLDKDWHNPTELHGVGQYGADAYFIFCRGAWRAVAPADKDLARYHAWLAATGGEGTGLAHDAEAKEDMQLRYSWEISPELPKNVKLEVWQSFATRCVILLERSCTALRDFTGEGSGAAALDLQCGAGGTAFELATVFSQVVGVDSSSTLIRVAEDMRAKLAGQLATGELQSLQPGMQPLDIDADKFTGLSFSQAEVESLPNTLRTPFDAVLVARWRGDAATLSGLPALVKAGGVALIAPDQSCLHGVAELGKCMGEDFEHVDEEDIAQVTEPAPGLVYVRTVRASVWRRLSSPEITAAVD